MSVLAVEIIANHYLIMGRSGGGSEKRSSKEAQLYFIAEAENLTINA